MAQEVDPKDYLWIITINPTDAEETFLGLQDADGQSFIPATSSKEECMALAALLPDKGEGKRQVEAIHIKQLLDQAANGGYQVYVVNSQGKLLKKLEA